MRLPKRRHELLKTYEEEGLPVYLTAEGARRLEAELKRLETKDQKQAIEDVARTGAFGDRSENAEYQEAKHRLSRTHSRIFYIKERLKRVVVIRKTKKAAHVITLGSTVVLQTGNKERTYEIVGPSESNPANGRISHVSPLGEALLGHAVGDSVDIETANGKMTYSILRIS
jgi:transcription elongation factor GreA